MNSERAHRLLTESGLGSCFRPRDAEQAGIEYHELRRLEEAGIVEHERRGLYRRTDVDFTRFSDIAAVCAQVPDAIVCLLTALTVHEIGTQLPVRIWIAIPQGRRTPVLARSGLEIVRFSGLPLRYGGRRRRIRRGARPNHRPGTHCRGLFSLPQPDRGPHRV